MKKLPLLLLTLLFAGCISGDAEKTQQAVCDSINAEWPLCVDDIELCRVSYADRSYTIHIVAPEANVLEYANKAYYADEELTLQYGSYGAPCNEFVRKLRDTSPAFDSAVILLGEMLWDGESNQGYLPLYIEMKARRDADNSIRLQHNDGWY